MNASAAAGLPSKVLLTGASRGIGAAIARALLARGVRLAVVGRDRAALEALVGAGGEHAVLVADLADRAQVTPIAERAAAGLGGLDGFVSCAGVVEYAPIDAISAASLERQLAVNFTAPFMIAQGAANRIAAHGGGAMLFVSSTLAIAPAPHTAAYAASKAALGSLVRSLALELGPRSIRVNALAPGVVDTDMVRVVRPAAGAPEHDGDAEARIGEQLEALRRLHPLGRLGQPDDVAQSALYLLSARYVTGNVMAVDGGLLLGSGRP
jgi:NAD(P)-dependent dehydrogenase (short-subunit alcohol dehydrogenase family)